MNRENKRIKYTKGYYKNHACNDSFICKVCGRPVVSAGAGRLSTETTVPIACAVCMWMKRQATVRQTAAELWSHWSLGTQGRRVGNHSQVPTLRETLLESKCSR